MYIIKILNSFFKRIKEIILPQNSQNYNFFEDIIEKKRN